MNTEKMTTEAADMIRRAIESHVSQLYRQIDGYRDQNNPEAVRACMDEIRKYQELKKQL